MLSIHEKIDRAQRLIQLLEDDVPLLDVRVSGLTPERQRAAKDFAAQLTATARAELNRLIAEQSYNESVRAVPEAAD
jgi:alkylhydroperoxidase family enzyme